MRDRLAKKYPGLRYQPKPGTPECNQLESELAFAIDDHVDETPEMAARTVLRFMIGRGFWPLGTRIVVGDNYDLSDVRFPKRKQS